MDKSFWMLLLLFMMCFTSVIDSVFEKILVWFLTSNSKNQSIDTAIFIKTKCKRLRIFTKATKVLIGWFIICFLVSNSSNYYCINTIKDFANTHLPTRVSAWIGYFAYGINAIRDFVSMFLSALLGALIGYILTDGIDSIENFFDKDLLNELVIKKINSNIINDNRNKDFQFSGVEYAELPDTRDESTKDKSKVEKYEYYKSTISWETPKYRIRCYLDSEKSKLIHDENIDTNINIDRNISNIKIVRLKSPIKIKMCLDLLFSKPNPKEEYKNGYDPYIYAKMRLTAKLVEGETNNYNCTIIPFKGEKDISTSDMKSIELDNSMIDNCLLSSMNSYYEDRKNKKHKSLKFEERQNETGGKFGEITFYSISTNIPLKNVEQDVINLYVMTLSNRINNVLEDLLACYTDNCNQKEKYLDIFDSDFLVTSKQMDVVNKIEKKNRGEFFSSINYSGKEASLFIKNN